MNCKKLFGVTLLVCWATAPSWPTLAAEPPKKAEIEFNKSIRPILSENCFACHGPDEKARKAKLRFDLKEDAFKPAKSGDLAIVPGDPSKSKLIERINTQDEDDVMPPVKSGKKLTADQKELLRKWIADGAKWQNHWAYVKPVRPELPKVQNTKWAKNPIDNFVLARLEKEKLKPSPEADKPTLLRRVSFDLTGLPPTTDELDAFLADKTPKAYEKVVDRLLDSPRYGEHMARYWMDAARYADSHGFHIDSERSIWKWRDWVIDAYNKNIPFDQFTVEQLAGDLIPNATPDQKTASGFVRCNMSTGEGGAIVEEYQAKYTFDRTETMSTVWLGLTLTCARCHTHKYDPITNREYYQMYAFFNNIDESVMDGNQPTPDPTLKLPTPEQSSRQAELKKHIAETQEKIDSPMPSLDKSQSEWAAKWHERLNSGWETLKPSSLKSNGGADLKTLEDNSVLASGTNADQDTYEFVAKLETGSLAALQLETLPDDSLPAKSAGRGENGQFALSKFEAELIKIGTDGKPAEPQKLKFAQAVADSFTDGHDASKALDDIADSAWRVATNSADKVHLAVFRLADPAKVEANTELHLRLKHEASKSHENLGHFRLRAARESELVHFFNPPKAAPWQLIGPFASLDNNVGYSTPYPPEKAVELDKGYEGVRGEIRWGARGDLDTGKPATIVDELHGVHGAYYLYRTIQSPTAHKTVFTVRADELFKVWLNGKLIGERAVPDKSRSDSLRIEAELQQGENKILVKMVNQEGGATFAFNTEGGSNDILTAELATILTATAAPEGGDLKTAQRYFRKVTSPEVRELAARIDQLREEESALEKSIPITLVAREMGNRRETTMLMRGEYDKKGDKVTPGVPSILPPLPSGVPTNRLGLAKWLVDPSHPLTSRVTVNHFWQQYFGTGLVKTTEDFGVQGERPSHPELLDWLATEFVSGGWDIKKFQKLIVTSATYRQASRVTPELISRDPENRLLARGPRFRLDGEEVRDTALAVSGLLVEQRGGKSVKPYEPPGLWETVSYNNVQKYVPDHGDAEYRRSLYTHWKRQSPPPNMMIFDAPTREYCVVKRPRTNTPLQALVLLNDPQFVEASRAFAQRILLEGGKNNSDRLAFAFRVATGRKPRADETKILADILAKELADFKGDEKSAEALLKVGDFKAKDCGTKSELAAWSTIASVILNLDEVVTKS